MKDFNLDDDEEQIRNHLYSGFEAVVLNGGHDKLTIQVEGRFYTVTTERKIPGSKTPEQLAEEARQREQQRRSEQQAQQTDKDFKEKAP